MSEQDPWEPDWEGAPAQDSARRDAPGPSVTRISTPRRPLRPGLLSSLLSILPPLLAFVRRTQHSSKCPPLHVANVAVAVNVLLRGHQGAMDRL